MEADATSQSATWLAIVVMILHWLGPILKGWSDAAIARWLAGNPEALAAFKARQEGK